MCRVALQRSDQVRAHFMAKISVYDPSMFIWLDETGCDHRHTIRKYGYSIRGIPLCDQRLLLRGKRYNAIPIASVEGIHDVFIAEGTMNGDRFAQFVKAAAGLLGTTSTAIQRGKSQVCCNNGQRQHPPH